MRWHYAPREQPVPFAIEMQKHLFNNFSHRRVREQAHSATVIQHLVDFRELNISRILTAICDNPGGKSVGQPENYVLDDAVRIEMRKVTTVTPARVYFTGTSHNAGFCAAGFQPAPFRIFLFSNAQLPMRAGSPRYNFTTRLLRLPAIRPALRSPPHSLVQNATK